MWQPVEPKKASTVVLLRPQDHGKFEVLMTRRPAKMKFLGGYYVFPGGSLRKRDHSEAMFDRCRGVSPQQARDILGNQLSPEISLAHWVAAIRELFEEAGILLAVTETGKLLDLSQRDEKERLDQKRRALVKGELDFPSLLESEGLYCDAGKAVFFYHRVTPEIYSMRFDTRFYLAQLPSGQTPLSSSEEVVDSVWITPEQALESCNRGEFPLIPPTTTSLEILDKFDSWKELRSEYRLLE